MINETLFEIPIYSCTQEQFIAHVTAQAEKDMASVPDYNNGFWQEQRDQEIKRHLKAVRYNELIGCIEIHAIGTQLRADYWFTNKRRIVIGSLQKGIVSWRGKLLESHYRGSKLSSQEIFKDFRKAITSTVNKRARLKSRFVDLSAFDRCGPFVDWRALLRL